MEQTSPIIGRVNSVLLPKHSLVPPPSDPLFRLSPPLRLRRLRCPSCCSFDHFIAGAFDGDNQSLQRCSHSHEKPKLLPKESGEGHHHPSRARVTFNYQKMKKITQYGL